MEYRYLLKSTLGKTEYNGKTFERVEKVPLFSHHDIPMVYKRMLEKFLNVVILKRTPKGWIELTLKDVENEVPRGHKKAYKVAI